MCFFIGLCSPSGFLAARSGRSKCKAKNPKGVRGTEFPDSVNEETEQQYSKIDAKLDASIFKLNDRFMN
jgi:hypothetical protein